MLTKLDYVNLEGDYKNLYQKAALFYALDNILLNPDPTSDALIEVKDMLLNAQKSDKTIEEVFGDNIPKTLTEIKQAFSPQSFIGKLYTFHLIALFISLIIRQTGRLLVLLFNQGEAPNYLDFYIRILLFLSFGATILLIVYSFANEFSGKTLVAVFAYIGMLALCLRSILNKKRVELKYAYFLKKRDLAVFEKDVWEYTNHSEQQETKNE